jgi:hypothetical protein
MKRMSQRRLARIMLAFCTFFLLWDSVFLVGNLAVMPSRPLTGVFWSTLQVANVVTMIVLIGFWRKRIRRY